jgi:ribonuclease HI
MDDCKYICNNNDNSSNKEMTFHILNQHANNKHPTVNKQLMNAYPLLKHYTCPICHKIFKGLSSHFTHHPNPEKITYPLPPNDIKRYMNTQRNEIKQQQRQQPPSITSSSSSSSSTSTPSSLPASNHPHDYSYEPDIDHPLPPTHPRVWENIPRSLIMEFLNIVRPAMIAYRHSTDPEMKAHIITDLHRVANELFTKLRGERGKTLSSLSRRLHSAAATVPLFSNIPQNQHLSSAPSLSSLSSGESTSSSSPSSTPSSPPPPIHSDPKTISIYTDGSCMGNRYHNSEGHTGIGVVIVPGGGGEVKTIDHSMYTGRGTNNKAELQAILLALEQFKEEKKRDIPLVIYSDSKFAIGQATQRAAPNLQHHIIIHKIHDLMSVRKPPVRYEWVKAHSKNVYNNLADSLAKAACINHSPSIPSNSLLIDSNGSINYTLPLLHAPWMDTIPPPPPAPLPLPSPFIVPLDEQMEAKEYAAENLRRRVHRAVALVRAGHIGRAVQAIERPGLPLLTPRRIRNLLSLHPSRHSNIQLPSNIDQLTTPTVNAEALTRLIKQCDDGASAGPSNLTMGHLRAMSRDPECLLGLVAIVQDIINNDISPTATAIITSAISVAIDKPSSTPDIEAVRPLAVPESLYKLASLVCLESIAHALPTLFPRIQLGCGIKGGVEIAVHRTQLALETGGPGTVVLRTDFRNAFNERKRHIIAQALFSAPSTSKIWRFFALAYGGHDGSQMGIYQRGELIYKFINNEGVKQGCPLAAFLYALSVQKLYEKCIDGIPDLQAYAIADDFTIIGPSSSIIKALDRLIHLCNNEDGPALNLSKCEALWA